MKVKNALLSILFVAAMATAMSFTQGGKSDTTTNSINRDVYHYDFRYIGPADPYYFNDYLDPDNYVMLSGEEFPGDVCEFGNDALCVISSERYWNGYEWKPDLSDTSFWNTRAQLYSYYYYGAAGMLLTLKVIY
ncbi:MAG TPA: hypothetical protein VK541_25445 [Pedobacter sp.]|uniref:hypothetical protein n=1 Tax=Pedobacter sp. TaxID=1411316 RepID=UPI002BFD7151|nr:hypothetical protein [Pedobacter sp.]HMI05857.1 hypothetical protein [Pedobacter sp.]